MMTENGRAMIEIFRGKRTNAASTIVHYAGKEHCLPNQSFGPAKRAQYLLHFITEGSGTFQTDGKVYHLTENHVFLIKPGEVTFYQADEETPWSYMWFAFSSPDAEIILQNCGLLRSAPFVKYPPSEELNAHLESIIELLQSQSSTDYAILADMFSVFAYLTQSHRSQNVTTSSNPYIIKATDFIVNNYAYPIGINQIADFVGVERSYLYRLFLKELHVSPKKYLTSYRILVAQDLLTNTQLSIGEIAHHCGFSDNSTFSKSFSNENGLSPLQYRKIDGKHHLSWKK